MIKNFIILFMIIFAFSGCERMELVIEGNDEKKPLEFNLGFVQCPQCHMEVETLNNAAQAVMKDGKTYIFDDVGCVILWMEQNSIALDDLVLWVYAHDIKKWVDMKKAYFSLTDKTPMEYGFGAYEKRQDGFITFEEMQLKMLRGENMTNPKIRKKLLGY